MELRDIEYFAVVAEHRHLGRAAEAVDLSTSALSKSLRRLEGTLQVKLVRRTPKGVELTPEGELLHARIHKLRMSLTDIAREVTELDQGRIGHLRIGTFAGTGETLLAPAVGELLREAPNTRLSISLGNSDVHVAALRRAELDLHVGGMPESPYDDVAMEHLYDDTFVACVGAGHRLAGRQRVELADLACERWVVSPPSTQIYQNLHRAFKAEGLPKPTIAMDAVSTALQLRALVATELVGCLSQRLLREVRGEYPLVTLPLRQALYVRRTGIGYRKDGYLPPLARRFVDTLKQSVGSHAHAETAAMSG